MRVVRVICSCVVIPFVSSFVVVMVLCMLLAVIGYIAR